ncbi:MAG: IS30 family transposase [Bacilli bacterium]|nr:IS30 family transposase [Bacilli bacterium]
MEPRVYSKISNLDMLAMDEELIHGIRDNGQSLHHLYVSSKLLQLTCCERTIRRYIYKGYMTVKAHELPRYVRYSHKYDYAKKKIVNVERMLGRTFSDFLNYVKENPDSKVWEYDSVVGKVEDKKAILTITFPQTRFQFGLLITKESYRSVNAKIRNLQSKLGNLYEQIFEVNLSDNGVEFTKFHELETDEYGVVVSKVFFTNPYKATDKPHCERNHEFVRYLIPKGVSLDFLTQEKVNLMFSHINSYVRASNKNKTPYELMFELFGEEFMNAIGIKRIRSKDVCLKPSLIRTTKK